MLRSDFDNHQLWVTLRAARDLSSQIRGENSPTDIASLERVDFLIDYIESFRALVPVHAALFTEPMLEAVNVLFPQVSGMLTNRINTGAANPQFTDQAAIFAENSLIAMGPWPRPYARGAQVSQMTTLFEGLLELQRLSVESLNQTHDNLRGEITAFTTDVESTRADVIAHLDDLSETADEVAATVFAEKARVDQVVKDGLQAVVDIGKENTKSYGEWIQNRSNTFESDFGPMTVKINKHLVSAEVALAKLQQSEAEYAKLVSAVAAGELAKSFQREALFGRIGGVLLYLGGVGVLGVAAIPLGTVITQNIVDPSIGQIIARLSIGVLGASAATVIIRLGSRFVSDANANKRMELEMRTLEPFLSTVEDRDTVDAARLQIVDRAFGKSYAPIVVESDKDMIPVSALSQILASVTKLLGR